jgi:O-antigen/teichoic acid export membrane protein
VASISSGGLNHSVLRLFSSYADQARSRFINTIRLSTLSLGIIVTTLYLATSWGASAFGILDSIGFKIVVYSSPLILIRVLTRIELSLFRISDRVMLMNFFNILIRYGGIGASIWFVYKYNSLLYLYLGTCITEFVVMLLIFGLILVRIKDLALKPAYHGSFAKEAFSYGVPLAVTGLLSYVLANTDRYVIGYFFNSESVADYTVAVNFCNYPIEVLRNVFLATFIPMIMNSWNTDESGDESSRHLSNYIASYFWLACPIVFGLTAIDLEGIQLLAGERYSAVPFLTPMLSTSFALNGMSFVCVSGLLYRKKSKVVLYINGITGIINLLLNIVLVPSIGIYGAALSTFISYLLFICVSVVMSRKELTYAFPKRDIFLSLCAGAAMALLISLISPWIILEYRLAAKIAIGFLFYGGFLLLFAPSRVKVLTDAFRSSATA